MNKKSFVFRSSSGLSDIFVSSYFPAAECDIKGVIQIAHGMAEHHERYEDFIEDSFSIIEAFNNFNKENKHKQYNPTKYRYSKCSKSKKHKFQ